MTQITETFSHTLGIFIDLSKAFDTDNRIQGIIFIGTRAYREIFKSALVYL